MKYLFIIQTLANGGAERVVSIISTVLTEQKQSVTVVKYFSTDNEYTLGDKVNVVNLSSGGYNAYLKMNKIGIARKLRNVLKVEKPDFIIPFTFPVAQLTSIAAIGMPQAVFQSIRIDPATGPKEKWKRIWRDRLVYQSKCSFVQNEQQKQYFKEKYHDKIHVLYNPIPDKLLSASPKVANDIFTVCGMGRLSEQKNFPLLIKAFSIAFAAEDNVELKIYGEGELCEELQMLIDETGLSDRIKLMGRTNNIQLVFEQTDLFVLSSYFEGMPNALIEAMACHVPCVSVDCPTGPADLIDNGKNGFLVQMQNPVEMAKAMRRVYEMEPEERFEIAERGRQIVRNKCLQEQVTKRMISICESVINRK